jgi:aquaporin Z
MQNFASIPVTACIAEFVGTFLLVFTVGCNVLSGNGTFGAVSIACVLMVSIYAFGATSGGHFNPAVTLALQLARKLEKTQDTVGGWTQVATYWVCQLCGGLVAALAYVWLFDAAFPLAPKAGFVVGAAICEVVYTFMLSFVVLNTAASKAQGGKNQYFGLAIAFVIIAGGFGAGALGAGCFNPAVAMSIYASSVFKLAGPSALSTCSLYVIAELVGAAIAVALFQLVRPEERSLVQGDVAAPDLKSKLISELIGTYMLVVTVGLNVLGNSPAVAFSIAASLTCMIYAVGDISGGHFNPAVTAAIFLSSKGKDTLTDSCKYAVAQVTGAILAALTYAFAHNGATFPLGPGAGHGWGDVAVAEVIFTFVLTFVVLAVAVVDKPLAPEFIG